ncbi:hypothetical protein AX16_005256 [Volvariella volvacea WC 439]|nr:hypothetical protein AX16_005256 [Volvariella volvacea WC 439]
MLAFRVSLCQKMITAASATLDDPAPSAQPRAARKARKVIGSSSAPASNVSTQETVTCSYKPSLPSVADILSLMKQRPLDPSQVAPDPDLELIKFTLLSSYGFLQGLPHVDKDDSWGRELRTGKLHECAERVFSDNVSRYQNMKALLDLWRGIITA